MWKFLQDVWYYFVNAYRGVPQPVMIGYDLLLLVLVVPILLCIGRAMWEGRFPAR